MNVGSQGTWNRSAWIALLTFLMVLTTIDQPPSAYLKPDVLIDSTIWRWKMKKRMTVGRATTVEAAMMYCCDAAYCWRKLAIPVCTTQRSRLSTIVSGHRNEFQLARKKKTESAARIGLESGRMMFQ